LMESAVYDASSGQLISASLMDYALPRAADIPPLAFETCNVPCRTNPLGVKGAGEAGAIGSCPAGMNAIADALWRAYRIRHVDMPATAERGWAAIAEGKRGHTLWPAHPLRGSRNRDRPGPIAEFARAPCGARTRRISPRRHWQASDSRVVLDLTVL